MDIYLYNNNNPSNTINKTLTNEKHFNINFKDIADINNPTIKLTSTQLLMFNYCYIPDFERYYFINNISTTPNGVYILTLKCDVLESFKDDILQSDGLVTRHKDGSKFFDSEYYSEITKEHLIYNSNVEIEFDEEILLVTIGGA